MESVELKLREIDNGEFVVGYTKKIVEILGEPEMSLEVKAGQISEDVCRLVGWATKLQPRDPWKAGSG
jgi:hypothetical protein